MQDGLYFFNTWVAEVDIVLHKQANDLTNPSTLQTSYANSFTLPDTVLLRSLLQNAEQVDSGGRDPYRLVPARIIDVGEVVFSGTASLQSFQGGWKILLAGPARSLFDQLADTKLTDLDLSDLDHKWNLASVANYAGAETGLVYPLIDYGSIDGTTFAQDTITPAPYALTLIHAMLKRFSYRAVGNWLNDPLLKRIVVPFTNDNPSNHDEQWVEDRQARVGTPDDPNPLILRNGQPVDLILPLTIDNQPLDSFQDGRLNCYKADRATYVCLESGRFNVQATVNFTYYVIYGAPEIKLQALKNGQVAAEKYWSEGGDGGFKKSVIVLTLDESILCKAGDELQIRLRGNARTQVASYRIEFNRTLGMMYAAFAPDPTVQQGDDWPVAANLPDMSCADLLKSVALMCSATFDIDDYAKTIELKTLDGVLAREAQATDVSEFVEESAEPELSVILEPYGQKNYLKWKALDDKLLAGYGDGAIGCDAQNIPLETTLFELPFSAVVDSDKSIPGYGNPVFIETRTVSGSGANLQVQAKATTPRLLLVEPSKMITVTVNEVQDDLTTIPKQVQLMACWWAKRQAPIQSGTNSFCLAFDRPAGGTGREQTLIQRYFSGMKRVLRRPRQLTVSAYLRPRDFATLDLYSPVRIRGVRVGSLDINDNYFYLNKVSNYRTGVPCSLILIAY